MNDNFENALAFVRSTLASVQAVSPQDIQLTTRLREDLGVDGDDWDVVVREICAAHPVDWSGFRFTNYFHPEPSLWALFMLLRRRPSRSISVEHLVRVVQAGRWLEPG